MTALSDMDLTYGHGYEGELYLNSKTPAPSNYNKEDQYSSPKFAFINEFKDTNVATYLTTYSRDMHTNHQARR